MSEFKFACPVCGQHITADSSASGGHLECPTCFRKIVIPQATSSADSKFIVAAAQVGGPRPVPADAGPADGVRPASARTSMLAAAALLLVLCAAGAAFWTFRDRVFKPGAFAQKPGSKHAAPRTIYPIPTNITWTLDLASVVIPEQDAVGNLRSNGFFCERATLTGGNLSLRQGGRSGAADLGVSINFYAKEGEELSGKSIEIPADRLPPLPPVEIRWKDEAQKTRRQKITTGYALKVVFSDAAFQRIRGKIYLGLPDEYKSFVAGTFEAEIRKPEPPKPHPPKPQKPQG